MDIEGRLDIELVHGSGGVSAAIIRSRRPLGASRVLEGGTPEQALQRLPLIFSLCATAQAEAALGACEQALGRRPAPAHRTARGMLVAMESAREHLLRILLDWPAFAGEAVTRQPLPALMRLLPGLGRALYGEAAPFRLAGAPAVDFAAATQVIGELRALVDGLLGGPLPASRRDLELWLARGASLPARLLRRLREQGWDRIGWSDSAFLPGLEEALLHGRLVRDETFVAAPLWQGTPCETTPLQRRQDHPLVRELLAQEGNGLLTRLAALLAELAAIPAQLQQGLAELETAEMAAGEATTAPGIGLAQVEAARGRLIHRVEIEDGLVRRYQILAPTEWNFHPRGVAAQGLRTLAGGDAAELRQQATLWISAIDPCVGFDLQVRGDA